MVKKTESENLRILGSTAISDIRDVVHQYVSEYLSWSTTVSLYFSSRSSKRMAMWAAHSWKSHLLLLQQGLDVSKFQARTEQKNHSQSGSFQATTGRSYPVPSSDVISTHDSWSTDFVYLGGILSIFVLGWFTGEWFISFFVPTNLVTPHQGCLRSMEMDQGQKWWRLLARWMFSKHQSRLQSPMDDPPICTCCQESHGAHKWRRNKRMPARWCRCMATIAVFLPSITGKIVKWHLPSTIKLEDWRCTLANHYNTRFERIVCPDLMLSILYN